ncbi:hypothetical protein [Cohnella cholangitidis]|uniref:Uncharacterized protein n=1 Tax=Cohnella cholangitidis TaxID=2598458 RepID=A0A7G5C0G8_9BACL|nr:hypothetical protein [Cohnella cholangitidis]QMV42702.1 hypothetical protein FPL14_17020 [Cohnella cholangitidis]
MYEIVKSPGKKVTQKWLDKAFAPLSDYLGREYPEEKDKIMSYLMFMGNEEGKFHYKNSVTRAYIVFDQGGRVVSRCDEALQYQFDEWFGPRGEYKSLQDYRLHPNVTRWIERNLSKAAFAKYGLEVGVFLQELWGPMVNYDFSDLKVGYPLRGPRLPYCLYLYPAEYRSLVAFQFIGDEIVERKCTIQQYYDFLNCEREITFAGWQRVDIIHEMLEHISPLRRDLPLVIRHACHRM